MLSPVSKWIISATVLLGLSHPAVSEQLSDPTRPYSAPKQASTVTASFSVSAIFISPDRRIAIVNGRRVAAGDVIEGARVVEILPDKVRLDVHGEAVIARLLPATSRN